ncbi:MAG: hypothetical protein ACOXZW_02915 [Bacilli bacterium]|jgi:hypothetical protein|nr:hypothetical protein [Bacilli bacterium]
MSKNWPKILVLILFLAFFVLYLAQATGYHEYEQYRRVRITQEKIKQFEADVKAGKPIDIDHYIESDDHNYHNKASEVGFKTSRLVENIFHSALDVILNIIRNLFV